MLRKFIAALIGLALLVTPALSAIEKWVAGATSSWTSICSSELVSLPSLDAVQCSTVVSNGTNNDLYIKFSGIFASVTSGGGSPYVGIYIYPKNEDGSYGDGQFGSAAAGPPSSNYMACSIPAPPSVSAPIVGSCYAPAPPTDFKVVAYNNLLVQMSSGTSTIYFQTFNRQVN